MAEATVNKQAERYSSEPLRCTGQYAPTIQSMAGDSVNRLNSPNDRDEPNYPHECRLHDISHWRFQISFIIVNALAPDCAAQELLMPTAHREIDREFQRKQRMARLAKFGEP